MGPLLYTLYTVDICHVVQRHNLRLHFLYADNCQVYTSVAVEDAKLAASLTLITGPLRAGCVSTRQ